MKLTKDCIGKKVSNIGWDSNQWFYVGYYHEMDGSPAWFGHDEFMSPMYVKMTPLEDTNDWEYYQEPKKIVRYAPALIKDGELDGNSSYVISRRLFYSSEDAKQWAHDEDVEFIKWPANDSMWCEIEEG